MRCTVISAECTSIGNSCSFLTFHRRKPFTFGWRRYSFELWFTYTHVSHSHQLIMVSDKLSNSLWIEWCGDMCLGPMQVVNSYKMYAEQLTMLCYATSELDYCGRSVSFLVASLFCLEQNIVYKSHEIILTCAHRMYRKLYNVRVFTLHTHTDAAEPFSAKLRTYTVQQETERNRDGTSIKQQFHCNGNRDGMKLTETREKRRPKVVWCKTFKLEMK